jgi:hypothetical protein
MSASDFILFLVLLALFLYWLDSIRAKELATEQARSVCKKVGVEFLDETVAIKKLRLRRNTSGHMVFYREYQFEFTSTGEYRYKGHVILLGKFLLTTGMEPYQVNATDE